MDTSGVANANGQRLYFEVHGEGDPLVLVMGIGYDSSLWKLHQVPALSRRFQVILLDNRDVGQSAEATEAYSIEDMADDVAALLDELAIPRAHVLGLSMGALIAQEFALRHSERIDRLVLAGPDSAPARQSFHPIALWSWIKANDTGGAKFAAQQFVSLFSTSFLRTPAAVQSTLELLASNPHPVHAAAYARQADAYLEYDPSDRLHDITAPTLVIVGEQDVLTPPWIAREVAESIPGAQLAVIEGDGASHVLPLERPAEFNQLVIDFLMAGSGKVEQRALTSHAAFL